MIKNVTEVHALSKRQDIPPKSATPLLKPNCYYMYHQFNIHKFYVLPTHSTYVFYVDMRTNSDYFPIQH